MDGERIYQEERNRYRYMNIEGYIRKKETDTYMWMERGYIGREKQIQIYA